MLAILSNKLMFISEILGVSNFGVALFTMLVYLVILRKADLQILTETG